jgi:hypothetical protein
MQRQENRKMQVIQRVRNEIIREEVSIQHLLKVISEMIPKVLYTKNGQYKDTELKVKEKRLMGGNSCFTRLKKTRGGGGAAVAADEEEMNRLSYVCPQVIIFARKMSSCLKFNGN